MDDGGKFEVNDSDDAREPVSYENEESESIAKLHC